MTLTEGRVISVLDLGALFARVELDTTAFDRAYVRVVREFSQLSSRAQASAGGVGTLDRSLTTTAASSDAAAAGITRANGALRAAAVSSSEVAASAGLASKSMTDLEIAQLRLVAAQDRLDAAQTSGAASAGRLASAQASVLRAEQQLAAIQTREAESAQAAAAAQGRHAAAVSRVSAVMGPTAAATSNVQMAQLALIASQERLDALMASGAASAGKLATAEASVARASQALAAAQAEAAASTGAAHVATAGFGRDMAKQAGVLTAAVAIFKGLKIGIDYQRSLNILQAVTHAGADAMGEAADRAKELGNDLKLPGVSAADAADAMVELAKGGLSVHQAMIAAQGSLQLAGAASVDAATAARIQVNALKMFHLAASDAGHVADVLANTANAATGEITDMAVALSYVGPSAKAARVSLDDTATVIALLAKNGTLSSKAGTGLRNVLSSFAAPSQKASNALNVLGIEAYDTQGRFVGFRSVIEQLTRAQKHLTDEQFAGAVKLAFGKQALSVVNELAAEGAGKFDKMALAVGRAGGAAEVTAAKAKGLGGALSGAGSQLETIAITAFEKVGPGLEWVVRGFSDVLTVAMAVGGALGDAAGWFQDNEIAAGALAGVLTAALLPSLVESVTWLGRVIAMNGAAAFMALRAAVAEAAAAFFAAGGGVRGLDAAMKSLSLNPAMIALAVFAATAGAVWMHTAAVTREAKKSVDDYVDSLGATTTSLSSLQSAIAQMQSAGGLQAVFEGNTGSPEAMSAAFSEYKSKLEELQAQERAVAANEKAMAQTYGLTRQQVEELASANGINLAGSLTTVNHAFSDAVTAAELTHHPMQQAKADIKDVGSAANTAADDLKDLDAAWDNLVGNFVGAKQAELAAKEALLALDKALRKSHGSIDLNTKAGREARSQLLSYVGTVHDVIDATFKQTDSLHKARSAAREWLQGLKDSGAAGPLVQRLTAKIDGYLDGIAKKAPGHGKELGAALVHGLSDAGGPAQKAAQVIGGKVEAGLQSQKRKAAAAGKATGTAWGQGVSSGIDDYVGPIKASAAAAVSAAIEAARAEQDSHSPSRVMWHEGQNWGMGLALGIESTKGRVAAAAATVYDAIAKAVAPAVTDPTVLAGRLDRRTNAAINRTAAVPGARDAYRAAHETYRALNSDLRDLVRNNNEAERAANRHARELRHEADQAQNTADRISDKNKAAKAAAEQAARDADRAANHAERDARRLERDDAHAERLAQRAVDRAKKTADAQKAAWDKASAAAEKATQRAKDAAQALLSNVGDAFDEMLGQFNDFRSAISEGIVGDDSLGTLWGQLVDAQTAAASDLASAQQAVADAQQAIVAAGADATAEQYQALTDAQNALTAAQHAYNQATSQVSATGLQSSLDTILGSAQGFATDLTALADAGASKEFLAQIAQMGYGAGDALAKALLAAGPDAIASLQTSMAAIQAVADGEGDLLAEHFYGGGLAAMDSFIRGLMEKFPELKTVLTGFLMQIDQMLGVTPDIRVDLTGVQRGLGITPATVSLPSSVTTRGGDGASMLGSQAVLDRLDRIEGHLSVAPERLGAVTIDGYRAAGQEHARQLTRDRRSR